MTTDAFGNIVHLGDIIAWAVGRSSAAGELRIGVVINPKNPTVVPFERKHDHIYTEGKGYHTTGLHWKAMRTFGFSARKEGEFVVIHQDTINDEQLKELIDKVRKERVPSREII